MATYHKTSVYPELTMENPMKRNEKLYCDLINKEKKERARWYIISIVQMLVIIALSASLTWAVTLPKKIPVVITVLPWGEAKYVGDVSSYSYENMNVPEPAYIYQVEKFIQNYRTIPTDGDILNDNITTLYHMISQAVASRLTPAIRSENPFKDLGTKKRTITIESTIRVSGNTWQVDYIETTTGKDSGTKRYRGIITTSRKTPPKKSEKLNPLGIYIDDFNLSEIKLIKEQ